MTECYSDVFDICRNFIQICQRLNKKKALYR